MMLVKSVTAAAMLSGAALLIGCSPAVNEKCPKFVVAADVGKNGPGTATFTLTPPRDGLTYNWAVSAGTITEGQGTTAIVVSDSNAGEDVTATVEVGGLDPTCPAGANTASASAKMP